MWVAAALAVGAAVFSYIGSRGNPTGSLLLSTFKGLEAIQTNLSAVNEGLQFLTGLVADMYKEIGLKIDLVNLKEYQELQKATLETAIKEVVAYQRTIELTGIGQQSVDPVAHYNTVGDYFLEARVLREALLESSAQHSFVGAMIACYAYRLDMEVLNYLLDLGIKVEKKRFLLGHLEEICNDYYSYLISSVSEDVKDSLVKALQADQQELEALMGKFGPNSKNPLPLAPGRYFAGTTKLQSKYYPTKYLDIPTKFGEKPPVEEPAHTEYWYSEYYLVVEEIVLGAADRPVSQFSFKTEMENRFASSDHHGVVQSFVKEYESAPSKIELKHFGDDFNFDDLVGRVGEYNQLFAQQHFTLGARINNWSLIIEAARITLDEIACNLKIIQEKDGTCLASLVALQK